MSNIAQGNHFCIATPHYKSSMLGMSEYITSRQPSSAALNAALSLTYNLPHLCGLGGDAIIMEKNGETVSTLNGTGKTGTHQNYENYLSKGMSQIPRRGIYSSMVYGCPSAYNRFSTTHQLDLERLLETLIDTDIKNGLILSAKLANTFHTAAREFCATTRFRNWGKYFTQKYSLSELHTATLRTIAKNGFSSLYSGGLGEKVYHSISSIDPHLYSESDFSGFTPNTSETKRTTFFNSVITAHGSNSPWRELFLLLKVYEQADTDLSCLQPESACTAAGLIDIFITSLVLSDEDQESMIVSAAKQIYKKLQSPSTGLIPQSAKQSHTIFMACADANGHLIGITNSIFTPLGSLFEADDTGIILSNRGYSFNDTKISSTFRAGTAAKHTNNCIFVETDDIEFIIGTSGGPVQTQTLALIIDKIVFQEYSVHEAIISPRHANMGINPKTKKLTYLIESQTDCEVFQSTNGLSDKLGVVQLAGRNKKTGEIFAVADPRGDGVALGL